jgi:dihydroorotase
LPRRSRRSTSIINRNAMLVGGIRPHAYCLPVAKRETHRLALRKAATSGSTKYFPRHRQRPACGERQGKRLRLRRYLQAPYALEAMSRCSTRKVRSTASRASPQEHGPRFYGLPLNEGTVTLERREVQVPEVVDANDTPIVPFHAVAACLGG